MLAQKLTDLIKVYDDMIGEQECKDVIDLFEKFEDQQVRIDRERRPNFTEFNLTQFTRSSEEANGHHKELHQLLVDTFMSAVSLYTVDNGITDEHPTQYALEELRIKRYLPEEDEFAEHVDVGNHNSARRYMSFFLYLNDVEYGGETRFPYLDLSVKPKRGRILVFPPLWMFPHAGMPTQSETKYIVGSYCHYL